MPPSDTIESSLRRFIDDALSRLPEAQALAATKHGLLRAYADGVNAGKFSDFSQRGKARGTE